MAKKVKTWLTDDKEAAEGRDVEAEQTILFGLDGRNFEIDLSSKNAVKLRNDIEQWMAYARPIGGIRKRTTIRPAVTRPQTGAGDGMDAEQRKACREWLRNNGWPDLADRGRIPADAMAAFHGRDAVA